MSQHRPGESGGRGPRGPPPAIPLRAGLHVKDEPPDGVDAVEAEQRPLSIADCQGDTWGLHSELDLGAEVKQEVDLSPRPGPSHGPSWEQEQDTWSSWIKTEACESDDDDVILVEPEVTKIVISSDSEEDDVMVVDVRLKPQRRSDDELGARVKEEPQDSSFAGSTRGAANTVKVKEEPEDDPKPKLPAWTAVKQEPEDRQSAPPAGADVKRSLVIKEEPEDVRPRPPSGEDHGWLRAGLAVKQERSEATVAKPRVKVELPDDTEPRGRAAAKAARNRPCPARFKPSRPCPARFKVKEERRSEDEDDEAERAARASLFGRRDSWDDLGTGPDPAGEAAEIESLEAEIEQQEAIRARPSTTLYPAAKPVVDPAIVEELKRKSQECKEKWQKTMQPRVLVNREKTDRLARLCAKVARERERALAARPQTIEAPPMPKRRAHQRAISVDAAHALQRQQQAQAQARTRRSEGSLPAKKARSPPRVQPQPTACSGLGLGRAPAPAPIPGPSHRVSDASSDSSEASLGHGRKQRVARKLPQWFQDEEDSGHSASSSASPSESSSPNPNQNSSPRDPRLKKRPLSDSDWGEPELPSSSPAPKRRAPLLPTPESPLLPTPNIPRQLPTAHKPPLLPTPSKRKWDDEHAFQWLPTRPRDPRLTKVKSEEGMSSGSSASCSKGLAVEPGSSVEDEDTKVKPPLAHKASSSAVRVLPPATHLHHSGYETRSPLYQEDDQPRKRYDSGDSKCAGRSLPQPSWLDNVLFQICKWKPSWLRVSENLSRGKDPDLLINQENINSHERRLQFSSKSSYLNYFQDLLLLELWAEIKKNHKLEDPKSRNCDILAAVDGPILDKPLVGYKKRITLTCQCGFDKKKPLEVGDLVVINNVEQDDKSEPTKPIFAYVETKCTATLLSPSNKLSPLLTGRKHEELNSKLVFKVTLCLDDNHTIAPKLINLRKIATIYEQIENFKHLNDFVDYSSLIELVLNPTHTPRVMPPPEDIFLRSQAADLNSEQKCVASSLIHDIRECETPSINVVDGGVGTGKTHLATALAQELIELSPKHKRDCVVFLATRTNSELNIIGEKLKARKCNNLNLQNKDTSFRAVWLGNDQYAKSYESLCEIGLFKLRDHYMDDQGAESLSHKIQSTIQKLKSVDRKLLKLASRNLHDATLKSEKADLDRELRLYNAKMEKNQEKDQRNDATNTILENCDIFLTTLSSNFCRADVLNALKKRPRKRVLIVDNASEVTEPTVLKIMVVYGITDLVLFGDPKQIGPYVLSKKFPPKGGLYLTMMERYMEALKRGNGLPPFRHLAKQLRLQSAVLSIVNDSFYFDYGRMVACSSGKGGETDLCPYIWFNCTYFGQNSNAITDEVDFVVNLLHAIQDFRIYKSNEKRHIRVVCLDRTLSNRLKENVLISGYYDAPDQLTSKECDIMIVSVGSSPEKIRKDRLLLSLTRACKSLFVCGNFSQDSPGVLYPLLKDARKSKVLEDITSSPKNFSKENITFTQMLMLKIRKL